MTGLRRLALGCALGFIVSGCALGNALRRGHAQVGRGQYRAALASYQAAQRIDPDSEEARRLSIQLVPYAVAEASAEARREMARGHYERVRELAHYVAALDRAAAAQLDRDNAALMHTAGEGLLRKNDHQAAYGISARLRDVYPQHPAVADLLERCRRHFYARAEQHASHEAFGAAIRAIDTVEHFEPALRHEVRQRRAHMQRRWAARIARDAAGHERAQHRGAAAALYARAYEIAHQPKHLAALRRNTAPLRAEGRFVLVVHTDRQGHANTIVARIREQARRVEGLSLPTPDDDGASLIATVSSARARCHQDTELEQGEQPFVSGYRQRPNPERERLANDIAALERRRDDQRHAFDTARRRARTSHAEALRCDRQTLAPAQTRVSEAHQTLVRAQQRHHRLRHKTDHLQTKLDALPAAAPQRAQLVEQLEELRRRLHRAEQQVRSAKQHIRRHRRQRDRAAQQCARKHDGADRQRHEVDKLAERRADSEQRLGAARSALSATPSYIEVEVIDTFRFPIQHITRWCEVSASLDLTPAWTDGQQRTFTARYHTRDRTHDAYPRYGVAPDPLRFPSDDAALIDDADRRAAAKAVAVIARKTSEYYAHMTQNAFDSAAQDPHGATDLMLAMLLAAPGQLSAQHKRRLSQHLARNYHLRHWQTLTE